MSELEEKLASVMNDPAMMQKIMSLAQSLGGPPPQQQSPPPQQQSPPPQQEEAPAFPDLDISMLQKLSGFAQQSGIDQNQQTLLRALAPYISHRRVAKLERAMRAAKMAGLATNLLGR